ncbi:hypothetical protein [Pseudarthrobacter sp. N5]|uniref:hypothetical protein n=1 Tax=Pseudarthrobacter sp. N5 TaxID=3418416 RepID=UPI003CFA7E9A
MNKQSFGQTNAGQQAGAPAESGAPVVSGPSGSKPRVRNEAILGPFTIRDLAVFAATLILFVASLLPMFAVRYNLWNLGSLFFLGLGIVLPLIVTSLFVARRLAPETKVRIGSLSMDQFASVVASFAVAFFFLAVAGGFVPSMLVALIGSLLLLSATVLARFIPYFAGDFLGRMESPAHPVARESAVPVQKPRTPKAPKPAKPAAGTASDSPARPAGSSAEGARVTGAAAAVVGSDSVPSSAEPSSSASSSSEQASVSSPATDSYPAQASAPEDARLDGAPASAGTAPTFPAPAFPAPVGAAPGSAAAGSGADAVGGAGNGSSSEPPAKAAGGYEPLPATTANPQVKSQEPIGATVDPASRPEQADHEPAHEAFWFAVAQHRTAVDPRTGAPAFGIEPGGWVLALEDRGHEFLVQNTDGRVGVLRDLSNIERG